MFLEQSETIQPHGATMVGSATTCRGEGRGQSGGSARSNWKWLGALEMLGDRRGVVVLTSFVCFSKVKNRVVKSGGSALFVCKGERGG